MCFNTKKWYLRGALLYKVNVSKMEIEWIDNATPEDKERYLQHYKVANNSDFKG